MATIHYFQGAQAEIELRVRIGILEAELKLCNTQKAASEQVVHKLADFIYTRTTKSNESDSTTGDIARLKRKLASVSLEKETLKEQLSQSNTLLSRLIPRSGKAIQPSNTKDVSPKVIIPVKAETQESSTVVDENSSDEEDLPSNPTENYPSLSTSFSSYSSEFTHIPRFVKKEENKKKEAAEQRIDEETSIVSEPMTSQTKQLTLSQVANPAASNPVFVPKSWNVTENAVGSEPGHFESHRAAIAKPLPRFGSESRLGENRITSFKPVLGPGDRGRWRGGPAPSQLDLNLEDQAFPRQREDLFYTPSTGNSKGQRTVLVSAIALSVNEQQLLSQVRGGILVQLQLLNTSAITKIPAKSALIEFYTHDSAVAYTTFRGLHPLIFDGMRASVQLLQTATWPMPNLVRNAIELWQYSRSIGVSNLPGGVNMGVLRRDLCVTPEMKWAGLEVMASFGDNKTRTLMLRFVAVKFAVSASRLLTTSYKYSGCKIRWLPDPCALPLETLLRGADEQEEADQPITSTTLPSILSNAPTKDRSIKTKVTEAIEERSMNVIEESAAKGEPNSGEISRKTHLAEISDSWEKDAVKRSFQKECTPS